MNLDSRSESNLVVDEDFDGYEIIEQLDERRFEDVKYFRSYQKSILLEKGWELEDNDIDFYIKNDENIVRPEDFEPQFIDDEEWIEDQLTHVTYRIIEEIQTYEELLADLNPGEISDDQKEGLTKMPGMPSTKSPSETLSPETTCSTTGTRHFPTSERNEKHDYLKNHLKTLKKAFSKLPEQTDLEYAQPFKLLEE